MGGIQIGRESANTGRARQSWVCIIFGEYLWIHCQLPVQSSSELVPVVVSPSLLSPLLSSEQWYTEGNYYRPIYFPCRWMGWMNGMHELCALVNSLGKLNPHHQNTRARLRENFIWIIFFSDTSPRFLTPLHGKEQTVCYWIIQIVGIILASLFSNLFSIATFYSLKRRNRFSSSKRRSSISSFKRGLQNLKLFTHSIIENFHKKRDSLFEN